jgi:hypothetical protein
MLATGANLLCMYMIVYVHIWLVVDLALWKILISQLGWWHSQYILYYPQKLKKSSKPPTRYRHMCIYIYIYTFMYAHEIIPVVVPKYFDHVMITQKMDRDMGIQYLMILRLTKIWLKFHQFH